MSILFSFFGGGIALACTIFGWRDLTAADVILQQRNGEDWNVYVAVPVAAVWSSDKDTAVRPLLL